MAKKKLQMILDYEKWIKMDNWDKHPMVQAFKIAYCGGYMDALARAYEESKQEPPK